ncbi:hypothetical protein M0R45_021526 [Rubus argutus]|uniref:Uncharacterized protein n=1 Tax=Rubus argutus TaxID=59490 RepID=A0AAW1XF57_RUBAR
MQTRKKSSGRTTSREHTSPKVSRAQKKTHENAKVLDNRVTEMITSSSRKQRLGGTHKKNEEPVTANNLNINYDLLRDQSAEACQGHDALRDDCTEHKGCEGGTTDCMLGTIFSPAFHISKHAGGEPANGVDFVKFFQNGDHNFRQDREINYSQDDAHHGYSGQETSESTVRDENCFAEAANISSEVSAIYLAMKNSKLECLDEHGQDHMSTDLYVDDDDTEEFDDFDPYLFIKNLPDLSSVVPTFRPLLLPKQTRSCPPTTLVLDLDETLVHSTLEPCDDADFTFPVNFNLQEHTVYVRCRPHLRDFLDRVSLLFEIIIFTASQSIYAEQLLNVLDPKRKIFRHRVFRDSCVFVEGNYLKDLSVLGRDLARVIIVDNSPQAFGFQVDNGIPIESWFDDRSDTELLSLLPFLESLVGVEDVRPLIAQKFNLREKIATADYPLNSNRVFVFVVRSICNDNPHTVKLIGPNGGKCRPGTAFTHEKLVSGSVDQSAGMILNEKHIEKGYVVAQKLKEAEITEQDSLLLTRNLLRIAIFNISYVRGLFPEKYFNDKSVPALEMKIKKLMPMDAESRRLIDWMEKGVYDALQKKYLKTLLFCVCEAVEGPMIEEYTFSFSYSNSESQEVSMNISRSGNKKHGGTFKCNSTAEITPNQMRSSACKMVRTLVQLMRTLDRMPEERTILMKLLYYDDVTPVDYEPPFFRCCTEEETRNPWTKNPLKMEVGNVNSKHLVLALKVKSVLDPCEDENDDIQDEEVSLGDDSSESDSEVNQSQEDQYIVAPAAKQQPQEDNSIPQEVNSMDDEDDTQDPEEDEQQFLRIKDWISSRHLDTVEVTDVLSNFPDISVVLTEGKLKNALRPASALFLLYLEVYNKISFIFILFGWTSEIMDRLVAEGVLSKTGGDTYAINRQKKSDYEFVMVKKELDCQVVPNSEKTSKVNEHLYMKALYHVLPMQYVSVAKLQNKLGGEANQNNVRKMIDKMAQDGFVEVKGNRRLGKRVLHSDITKKKLIEVQKALNYDAMDVDNTEPQSKSNHQDFHPMGSDRRDTSTCGVLHSIGSDLTRMRIRANSNEHSPMRSEQTTSKTKEHGNTPSSRAQPVISRESFAPGNDDDRANGTTNHCDEGERVMCNSRSTQDKRSRKTSTVKEPILQYIKRQKSQAL